MKLVEYSSNVIIKRMHSTCQKYLHTELYLFYQKPCYYYHNYRCMFLTCISLYYCCTFMLFHLYMGLVPEIKSS